MDHQTCSQELIKTIAASPSAFHAVDTVVRRLEAAGFMALSENDTWTLEPGGSYFTTRNGSSLIAFKLGSSLDNYHFQMSAAHTDSPTFKLKSQPALSGPDGVLRLNVEAYGGMIDYTWLDRPLSLAGRVMVEKDGAIETRLLSIDRDLLLIPSVAVHMNRDVNQGYAFNRQVDLCPLFSVGELSAEDIDRLIADELSVTPEQILAHDLVLVNRQPGCVWGAAKEFVSAPKLDDLQCVFASLEALLASDNPHAVTVCALFDNEEVGSGSKQGALSTLLRDTLARVNAALGKGEQDLLAALAGSFMVSCDNAHAVHPNHPELADEKNRPQLNAGVVIKEHAGQLYTTDALSRAVFESICRGANVPTQTFANRSDKRGGSTLGNLSNRQVSVHSVDIGLPQLAMHSAYETAGSHDTAWAIEALKAFFSTDLHIDGSSRVTLR